MGAIEHTAGSLVPWGVTFAFLVLLLFHWGQRHGQTTSFRLKVAALLEVRFYSGPAVGPAAAQGFREDITGTPDSAPTADPLAPQEANRLRLLRGEQS